jgi:hypothetical protein
LITFVDVVDSVGLYQRLGDVEAHGRIDAVLDQCEGVGLRAGGRVIKRSGDAVLLQFREPVAGVLSMVEMFRHAALQLRGGSHIGAVLERDGDVFGDTVNRAARVTSLAREGEILLTEELVAMLGGSLRARCRHVERRRLKGEGELQSLYRFDWEEHDVTRVNTAISITAMKVSGELRISTHAGDVIVAREGRYRIGRDPTCDLVVDDPRVSRFHATLEWHRGRFVLKDHSTNGSYIHGRDQTRPVFIRREELPLTGAGKVIFAADGVGPAVTFRYE